MTKSKECSCTSTQILAYQKRLSDPLLDRVDRRARFARTKRNSVKCKPLTNSQHMLTAKMINMAINTPTNRYSSSTKYNASIASSKTMMHTPPSKDAKKLLTQAAQRLALSARSYFKVIKVARTITDLAGEKDVSVAHISEALQYRS